MDRRHVEQMSAAVADVFASVGPAEARPLGRVSLDMMSTLATPRAGEAKRTADSLAWLAFFEILVFFGVLLVGFAYLWKRGDLAWVRSTAAETVGAAVSKGS